MGTLSYNPVSTEEWTLDESMTQKLSMSQHKLSKKTHLCSLKNIEEHTVVEKLLCERFGAIQKVGL